MEKLKYTVIKNITQYNSYCKRVEALLDKNTQTKVAEDEIELLTVLIEKYDDEHSRLKEITDPIQLLKSIMDEAQMKAIDLALLLGVSKGLVSDILNYKKGLSKEIIRKLAERFKMRQEAFNRPYTLNDENKTVYYKASGESLRVGVREPVVKYVKSKGKGKK